MVLLFRPAFASWCYLKTVYLQADKTSMLGRQSIIPIYNEGTSARDGNQVPAVENINEGQKRRAKALSASPGMTGTKPP